MNTLIANICFLISGVIWSIEAIPQLIKTFKRKSVADISALYFILCFFGISIFFIGAFLTNQWILILSHSIVFINTVIMLILIILYKKGYKKIKKGCIITNGGKCAR